jgi:predicted secreted hydrolase
MSEIFKPIEFPKDESAHKHIIEWWYFNGHLKDKAGNKYAFMNCLFRADVKKVKIPFLSKLPVKILYFYHSIISDITGGQWYPSIELATIVSEDSFSKPLLFINHTNPIIINGYTNNVLEETGKFVYHLKDKGVDLKLISVKEPLLLGGNGFIDLQAKKTYYYSLTNLKTEGQIKVRGKWIDVIGKTWMDHQWANASYSKDKWTWFSIQLDDETEMICFEYGEKGIKNYLASISYADGRQEHFTDVIFRPFDQKWTSPKTQATYPLSWHIKVPERRIALDVRPLINEQELVFASINYWEGPLSVSGTFGGKKVKGDGFMELLGYPSKYTNADYVKDELGKTILMIYSYTQKNVFSIANNIKTRIME